MPWHYFIPPTPFVVTAELSDSILVRFSRELVWTKQNLALRFFFVDFSFSFTSTDTATHQTLASMKAPSGLHVLIGMNATTVYFRVNDPNSLGSKQQNEITAKPDTQGLTTVSQDLSKVVWSPNPQAAWLSQHDNAHAHECERVGAKGS